MDGKQTQIIAKGIIVTDRVLYCRYNPSTDQWDIRFKNGRAFHYARQNVVVLEHPELINHEDYQIRNQRSLLNNISAIYQFRHPSWVVEHICFESGYEHSYFRNELAFEMNRLKDKSSKNVFDYLKEIANHISVKTEDDQAILQKQYEKIGFVGERSALSSYLNPTGFKNATKLKADSPIFPFGCNKSQYQAVRNALSNRISVIEGPPGTGKTQTILNIIANLVLQGKTVQVVSNNNSAIENVIEKLALPKYGMDFIVASLGRQQKKDVFIVRQTGTYPPMPGWRDNQCNKSSFFETLRKEANELHHVYELKEKLAQLEKEHHQIDIEQKHFAFGRESQSLPAKMVRKLKQSRRILTLLQEYTEIKNLDYTPSLLSQWRIRLVYGIPFKELSALDSTVVIPQIQRLFYETRLNEIEKEKARTENDLKNADADQLASHYTNQSLKCFRNYLATRFSSPAGFRRRFSGDELWKNPDKFQKEYPVVLSTTYTARSSLGKNALFDYVIMDEASQVDVATGALALSCAESAVIVGDLKQLPNVVTEQQKVQLKTIFNRYAIPDAYEFSKHSFLSSLLALFGEQVPRVMLCEHYRCDPLIIEFCNQKFYDGQLVVMTEPNEHALKLVTTVEGNHVRDHANQRQSDVIVNDVLPLIDCKKSEIGIIAPYNAQVALLRKDINDPAIDIATVHKFQGREKEVIILSTVDDIATAFSDDPNLLNVAVSRAKKKLIVVSSCMPQPEGSNLGDLIGFIQYNNCEVVHSSINSVFDYLYSQYEEKRLAYLKAHRRISEYDSENLMFGLIESTLRKRKEPLSVVCHQPLYMLFSNFGKMSEQERAFVRTGLSHLDFLIYNNVTKKPILAIEVDGFHFHKEGTQQAERDKLKNHILEIYGIPLLRFSTNGSQEAEALNSKLNEIIGHPISEKEG